MSTWGDFRERRTEAQNMLVLKYPKSFNIPPIERWDLCPLPWNLDFVSVWYNPVKVALGQFPAPNFKRLATFTSYLLERSLLQLSHHAMRKPKQSVESPHGDKLKFLVFCTNLPATRVNYLRSGWVLWHPVKIAQLMPQGAGISPLCWTQP